MTAARAVPFLSDETWDAIVAAAYPMTPDAEARAALDQCLHDHAGLQRDPQSIRAARDFWRELADLAERLGDMLLEAKLRTPWTIADPDRPQRELRAVRDVQRNAEAHAEGLAIAARVRERRADPAREWLYWRLFGIWSTHFGGELVCSIPPTGGAPYGHLIRFMQAVLEHALDERASPHTIRNAIRREQQRRGVWPL